MEKLRPTYDLDAIKSAFSSVGSLSITSTAYRDAALLGFNRQKIVEIIGQIDRKMFFKSMTTFGDHRVWQDVYHVPQGGLTLYVKLQAGMVTGFTVMGFKEKTTW